jgi:hypothetical protein
VWYSIGDATADRWLRLAARVLRKPRVMHWVGSDITRLNEQRRLRAALSSSNILHLAEVSWTARELQSAGLFPRIAALPPRRYTDAPVPLPETFTILLYVPSVRSDFYGRQAFQRLMYRLRDKPIRYVVVGGGQLAAPPGVEMENLGWRHDLSEAYKRSSLLIRFTDRDGLSLMVLEALGFGRHVLWTQEFQHTRNIRTYDDMEREVLELLQAHERGTLEPQRDAAAFIRARYSPEQCMRAIATAWQDTLLTDSAPAIVLGTP